ncbi:efflux RND transporter periplasmic adaptor subunit [Rhodospirillum centenum]|uniref:HlyD family secretion protein n=1 Tax=Rhodospirillum centenum (strain ATCC 51521 / SW) TaxID=414684 RepID=B6IY54_RHOCS|nr:efflux RND transporter periplasmic adaptor subunit [Rhodospirillum centenum]ACJ01228.1 HlyD family secretion protein [Rhodospirillum centenum SW]
MIHPSRTGRSLRAALAFLLVVVPGPAVAQAPGGAGGPPPAVVTAEVGTAPIAPPAEFVGRVEAVASFEARPRVSGTLEAVAFEEGTDVEAGQLLYVIEPAPYEAERTAAEAQLARAQAQLTEASESARRAEALRSKGTVSEAALDEAQAALASAEADVLAAKAQLQQTELRLSYTRIASPIAGRIGATAVTAGNLVTPETGVLTTVVDLDPIRVTFSVSDRQVLQVMQQTGAETLAQLGDRFVPTLRLATGADYPHRGRVEFMDNRVDPRTGTVTVRALFPNPDRLLLPGQYATVLVRPQAVESGPAVPVSAVQRDREGPFVLVVDSDNVARMRRVTLGAQSDGLFAVEQGLDPGEVIVVTGQQKARPGAPVRPVPDTASEAPPAGEAAPAIDGSGGQG